jgi:serine/threonine protein phosphatase 1
MLGDYVDRGPDSRGVIEFLMEAQQTGALVCLKGNHEDMMVRACRAEDSRDAFHWLCNGGGATLISYGASDTTVGLSTVPEEHLTWMEGLPHIVQDDHRIYVHAGIMPGLQIEDNDEEVCLWVRERFLRAKAQDFPADLHIVHGHSPVWVGKPDASKPELLDHRTNLDTAAFHTGILTVGVFDADQAGGPIETLSIV